MKISTREENPLHTLQMTMLYCTVLDCIVLHCTVVFCLTSRRPIAVGRHNPSAQGHPQSSREAPPGIHHPSRSRRQRVPPGGPKSSGEGWGPLGGGARLAGGGARLAGGGRGEEGGSREEGPEASKHVAVHSRFPELPDWQVKGETNAGGSN